MPPPARLADVLKTFVLPCLIALPGGYLFHRLGLPAAWMSGSLLAVSAAAIAGLTVRVPGPLASGVFLLLGIAMGSAVTPDTLRLMATWPVSMAGLLVLVPAIVAGIVVYLVRIEGLDRDTAFFAAIPGALNYVMALTFSSRADARAVAVIQSFRLVLLVAALPGLLSLAGLGGTPRPEPAAGPAPWFDLPLLVVVCTACGIGMERLKVPGGATVGAMVASALLHGSGMVTARIPEPVMIAGFVMIGVVIAARFTGTSLAEIRRLLRASVGAFLVGTAATVAVAAAVAFLAGLPVGKVILAYAPGGIEAMAILAFVLDMDPAFVGAHHLVRFLGIALLLPLAARLVIGRRT